jgi:hypothetical protein
MICCDSIVLCKLQEVHNKKIPINNIKNPIHTHRVTCVSSDFIVLETGARGDEKKNQKNGKHGKHRPDNEMKT